MVASRYLLAAGGGRVQKAQKGEGHAQEGRCRCVSHYRSRLRHSGQLTCMHRAHWDTWTVVQHNHGAFST
jgi:hypothetical protein